MLKSIWQQILNTKYENLPTYSDSMISLLFNDLSYGVQLQKDVLTTERKKNPKLLHKNGACAIVVFKHVDNPMTGLAQEDIKGLIRVSEGTSSLNVMGIAIKFFLDDDTTVNIVFNNQKKEWFLNKTSFFKPGVFLSTNIGNEPPETLKQRVVLRLFSDVNKKPTKLDVTKFFDRTKSNNVVINVVKSEKIIFVPNYDLNVTYEEHNDLRRHLMSFEKGSVLGHLYSSDENDNNILLGVIELEEKFVCSKYGDKNLFFCHDLVNKYNKDFEKPVENAIILKNISWDVLIGRLIDIIIYILYSIWDYLVDFLNF